MSDPRTVESDLVCANAILEAVVDALEGREPSDFMLSYPSVRLAYDTRQAHSWQPMATAPRDGTVFRAYAASLVDPDFNKHGSVEAWYDGEKFVGAIWRDIHDCWMVDVIEPSHWRPLPPAPRETDAI